MPSVSAMAGGKGGGGKPGEIFSLNGRFVHGEVGIPLQFSEFI